MIITEDTIAKEESQSYKQIYKNVENKKKVEITITPNPSPRIKKRLRQEQFHQEHNQMGKELLALAKTSTTKDMPISHDPLLPWVIFIQNTMEEI